MKWSKPKFGPIGIVKVFKKVFFAMDGGKEVIRKARLSVLAVIIIAGGASVAFFTSGNVNTSFLKKSDHSLSENETKTADKTNQSPGNAKVGKMLQNSEAKGEPHPSRSNSGRGSPLKYKAQQVLVSDSKDLARSLPLGTNLIGKTLMTIDTRQADQLVKVLLPYGGRASSGGEVPKNSILFGQMTYGGKGEKVTIKFTKGIFPSGEEFVVEAQALSPKDYSPGIVGEFHGNADMRVASSLGLTMVAGASDVMTEKESLGGSALQAGSVTPKANMKNAMYHGISQVAQSEASRQAESISQEQEYVLVPAGTDVIISLTKAYAEN